MGEFRLRKATEIDTAILFRWRNEPDTRKNSFNQSEITIEEHRKWLEKKLKDEHERIYILTDGCKDCGFIHAEIKNKCATINYGIAPKCRGQGLGKTIVGLLENDLLNNESVKMTRAEVTLSNVASQHIFEKLGYTIVEESEKGLTFTHSLTCSVIQKQMNEQVVLVLSNNRNSLLLIHELEKLHENVIVESDKLYSDNLNKVKPVIVISYNYTHIISQDIIDEAAGRIINVHTSILPYNRGSDPNFWSFIENSPKGVTIHKLEAGLDSGDVILQKEIYFNENIESFHSSYEKLQALSAKMVIDHWNDIKSFKISVQPQNGMPTYHTRKQFAEFISEHDDRCKFRYNLNIGEYKRMIGVL